MNFSNGLAKDEFDFSICYKTEGDYGEYLEGDKPEFIPNDLYDLLSAMVENLGEFRFIGLVDKGCIIINRCYHRNNYIWENVYFDELSELMHNFINYDGIDKIINCLLY